MRIDAGGELRATGSRETWRKQRSETHRDWDGIYCWIVLPVIVRFHESECYLYSINSIKRIQLQHGITPVPPILNRTRLE